MSPFQTIEQSTITPKPRRPKCHPLAVPSWGRILIILCLNYSVYMVETSGFTLEAKHSTGSHHAVSTNGHVPSELMSPGSVQGRDTAGGGSVCFHRSCSRIHGTYFCTVKVGGGGDHWGQSPFTRRKFFAILFLLLLQAWNLDRGVT